MCGRGGREAAVGDRQRPTRGTSSHRDDAHGLCWTVLPAIETADDRSRWELLRELDNEWVGALRRRLSSVGLTGPHP